MTTIHDHGYWVGADSLPHLHDASLGDALCEFLQGATVYDFGCGRGEYVQRMNEQGISALGFDGNPDTPIIAGPRCSVLDITSHERMKPVDWVTCLEVMEHVPQEWMSAALDMVCEHATKGIVLSWAVPGQSGAGHVNCKPHSAVKLIMAQRGFTVDHAASQSLRQASTLPWFRDNLFVFHKESSP